MNRPFCHCSTCPLHEILVEPNCARAKVVNPQTSERVRHEFRVMDPRTGPRTIYFCDSHYRAITSGNFTSP